MQQSTCFDHDSIRMVIEAMVGGVDVTIIRVEGGHGREEGDERHNNYFEPRLLKAIGNRHRKQRLWAANSLSNEPHLYRDEPNPLDAAYIKKEEHEPKHSSFHVERGIEVDAVSLMAVLMMIFAAVLFGAGFSA